ncbi:MAG: ring-cleaving dioxygenase [Caldilinea sp.]|uniref:ring-cleaving dioxygenase n=1 Tax=Caldilinea sp. TaxID=2293560 RepID=UPI003095BC61
MKLKLTGVHHLTAVTAQASENVRFYTRTLGMRLIKKTVNQDDVRAYHLFYGDGMATPGSDLTFFDWPTMPRERRGGQSITRTGLRVTGADALAWWTERFEEFGVQHGEMTERDGRLVLDFEDFEGQRLSLVDDGGLGEGAPWLDSPVPAHYQIRGLGPITMTVAHLAPTAALLTQAMGMEEARVYPNPEAPQHTVHVFAMEGEGPAAELHVAVRPDLPRARLGAGGVHHVAFRVPTAAEHSAWDVHLRRLGVQTSGVIDRYYFRSIYFREPNGVLFELATDGPGFTVDEPLAHLGERLSLPPFLEPHRAEIEAQLKPLVFDRP